jgi:CheY-like chemotaxis protein
MKDLQMMTDLRVNRNAELATVLYVEADQEDATLMTRAFARKAPSLQLTTVADGWQAVDYLSGQGGYGDRSKHPLPSVVLLDVKLPGMSGFDVLRWIREQSDYNLLPVLVLTSVAQPEDERNARRLGADWFLEIPRPPRGFEEIVDQLQRRWLAAASAAGPSPANPVRKLIRNKTTGAFLTKSGD